MKSKAVRVISVALVALVVVVTNGCGGSNGDGGDQGSGEGGESLRIGVLQGSTGVLASYAEKGKLGIDLWAKTVNDRGGVDVAGERRPVEVVYYDDRSEPDVSARLYEKMIEDGMDALVGPVGSANVSAVGPIAERHRVPLLAWYAFSDDVFEQGFNYVFEGVAPASQVTEGAIELAAEADPPIETVALVTSNEIAGREIREGAMRYIEDAGLRVVQDDLVPPDAFGSFPAIVGRLDDANPGLVLFLGFAAASVPFERARHDAGYSPPMVWDLAAFNVIGEVPKAASDGLFSYTLWSPSEERFQDETFGTSADFAEAFKAEYDAEPEDFIPALAAHHMVMLEHAIGEAGVADPEKLAEAYRTMEAETFLTPVEIDERGMNVAGKQYTTQIQDGETVVVYPSDQATGKPIFGE